MTISAIRNPLARRALVVLTVAAMLATLGPLWLVEAVCRKVRREFGEDIAAAWKGDAPCKCDWRSTRCPRGLGCKRA